MQINYFREKNLSYIILDEFFTSLELLEVEKEICDLKRFSLDSSKTKSATFEGSEFKKTGTGVFLDNLYTDNRDASAILRGGRKLFSLDFMEKAQNFDAVFGFIRKSSSDSTLLNYYKSGEEYKAHHDTSRISAVTFLRLGDFSGGEFCFPSQGITIEAKHNRLVIFPSCVLHCAKPIYGLGERVSIAQFISNKNEP
jgi:hypothetical protein